MSVTIVLVLFWSAGVTIQCCTEQLIHGYRLDGFSAEEIPNIGVHACMKECLLRQHCHSINYNTQQFLCEINDKSADVIVEGTKNPDFFFSNVANSTDEEILGHCRDSQCPSSYKCVHTHDSTACLSAGCAAGTYGKDGQCIPCPIGQYNGGSNMQWCSLCQPGTYQDQTGSISCKACPAGTYQPKEGKAACHPCPVGQYSLGGNIQCSDCPPGTYQDQVRSSYCKHCPSGTHQPHYSKTTADSCKPCGPGTHQPYTGRGYCAHCSAGYHQPNAGHASCLFCPEDTFQDKTGQTSCNDCSRFDRCTNQNRTMCYGLLKNDRRFGNNHNNHGSKTRKNCRQLCWTDANCQGFSVQRHSDPGNCYTHTSDSFYHNDYYNFYRFPWQCYS